MTIEDANSKNLEVILGRLLERADILIPVTDESAKLTAEAVELMTVTLQLTGAISARTQSMRVMAPPQTHIHASQLPRDKPPLRALGGS